MIQPAIEIVGVEKRFGEVTALDGINLTLHRAEFLSLLGPSGCGKSTLLRIIAGFETPTCGRVFVNGEDVTRVPPERRPTNIVFQQGALFPHMNVFNNIAYCLKLRKWTRAQIEDKVEEMLALVRLEGLGQRTPSELSGGQIQRAALARALAAEPSVLLLDEPLSALDLKLRQQMQLELREIQRKLGATFLYVTHDQTEALVMSDRIAVMNEGKIIQEGTPREIYERPLSVFAAGFIGETNLVKGEVVCCEGLEVTLSVGGTQLFTALSTSKVAPGKRAILSIRPEAIRIASQKPTESESTVITGKVAEIVYLGRWVRVGVKVCDGVVVWADLRGEEALGLEPGRPVALEWDPSAASLWLDDSH